MLHQSPCETADNVLPVSYTHLEMYEEKPLMNQNELNHLHEGENVVHRIMTRHDLQGNDIFSAPMTCIPMAGSPWHGILVVDKILTSNRRNVSLCTVNSSSSISVRNRLMVV